MRPAPSMAVLMPIIYHLSRRAAAADPRPGMKRVGNVELVMRALARAIDGLDLPAVEVKSVGDSPRRIAFLPHATLVGWINDKEILIVEGHLLVAYNVVSGARRKSTIRVEDAGRVFLR